MGLFTVFIIIFVAIVLISGILWLLSWLTKPEALDENPYAEHETASTPVSQNEKAAEGEETSKTATAPKPQISSKPDNLTVIEGIGPKISSLLNENGIFTFQQLAETKEIILESMLMEANLRIADPSTWSEQAALAADEQWEALQQLQDTLKGGRKVT